MVDFTKLMGRSAEDQAAADLRRQEESRAAEIKEREAKVKHTRTVTFTEAPDFRCERDGSFVVVFRGTDEQGRPVSGSYLTPGDYDRAEDAALIARFEEGQTLTMRGYFRPWKNRAGATVFSFVGVFLA